MSPSRTLDLYTASQRLAEHLAHPPVTAEGQDRWFEEVEIHLLACRVLLDAHADECAPERRVLLWDAPRVAPMLRRLGHDCGRLRERTEVALAAVRSPTRTVGGVRATAGELTRGVALHRRRQDHVYHEAFAVDIGGHG